MGKFATAFAKILRYSGRSYLPTAYIRSGAVLTPIPRETRIAEQSSSLCDAHIVLLGTKVRRERKLVVQRFIQILKALDSHWQSKHIAQNHLKRRLDIAPNERRVAVR